MSAISGTGMTMRVFTRTPVNFDSLRNDTNQVLWICQHIDVSPFEEVDLVVRAHTATIGSGASIAVEAFPDGWTPEDPALTFVDGSRSYAIVTLSSSSSIPLYKTQALLSGFGRLVSIAVTGTMPAGMTPVDCHAVLSIDLVMKGGDPSGIVPAFNTYRGYR
jgi:hypothetical protein